MVAASGVNPNIFLEGAIEAPKAPKGVWCGCGEGMSERV